MSLNWDFSTVADRFGEAVQSAEHDLRLEQAVYGLDAKDERELQALFAERLKSNFEVVRGALPFEQGKQTLSPHAV